MMLIRDPLRSQHRPEVVEASLDACLEELELDYLDVCHESPQHVNMRIHMLTAF